MAGLGAASGFVDADSCSRGANELGPRRGAYFAHIVPVAPEAVAAADALAAILPGIAVGRLDDAQRHLPHTHAVPRDIQLFGHEHRQRGPEPLAEFGLVVTYDDAAVRANLDEVPDRALVVGGAAAYGQAYDETAGNTDARNQETAPRHPDLIDTRVHSFSPRSSAAR